MPLPKSWTCASHALNGHDGLLLAGFHDATNLRIKTLQATGCQNLPGNGKSADFQGEFARGSKKLARPSSRLWCRRCKNLCNWGKMLSAGAVLPRSDLKQVQDRALNPIACCRILCKFIAVSRSLWDPVGPTFCRRPQELQYGKKSN